MFSTSTLILCLLLYIATFEMLMLVLFVRLIRKREVQPRRPVFPAKQIDPGKMVGVLQELQRLMKYDSLTGIPSLADLASVVQAAQAEFGSLAELEGVIQRLIARETVAMMRAQRKASIELSRDSKQSQMMPVGAGAV